MIMLLTRLRLRNIRNHRYSELECPPGVILLWGENGAGKTSVLEAVAMLCTAQTFAAVPERSVVSRDASEMELGGEFCTHRGVRHEVVYRFPRDGGRRKIEIDGAPLTSAADLIGRFPLVTLSPDHGAVTAGSPAERRRFLDIVVSQVSHAYLLDLIEFRRILRHRNALLAAHEKLTGRLRTELEPWDRAFAAAAVRIVRRRRSFIDAYRPYFLAVMRDIVGAREVPEFRYRQSVETDLEREKAADDLAAELAARLPSDHARRSTMIGPHRDDLEMLVNGMDVRTHASRGQHKTLLISLKAGEWFFLNDHLDERPVFLLDDVFSELDDDRFGNILRLIPLLGQTFVTTANRTVLDRITHETTERALYQVEAGTVHRYMEAA
ncbi:MAG: DNA replication and repair protein RecF [Bacteroidota bacterium]|nr:DNA replication and repair protein RecF [Bacteroidota bacterium]